MSAASSSQTTALVGVGELAKALNLTPRRIQQLVAEGVLPRADRGLYDEKKCTAAIIRYYQNALAAKGTIADDGEITTHKGSRADLVRVQTDRQRFELAKARGQVISVDDHHSVLATMVVETRARLRAVGTRVAPRLVNQANRLTIEHEVNAEVDLALSGLAETTPRLPSRERPPARRKTGKKRAPRATRKASPPRKSPRGPALTVES